MWGLLVYMSRVSQDMRRQSAYHNKSSVVEIIIESRILKENKTEGMSLYLG